MSVVSIHELHDGREGTATVPATGPMERKHSRAWRVITNSIYDGSYTVLAACPVVPGQAHPEDPDSYAQQAKAKNDSKARNVWIVTVDYTTKGSTPDQQRSPNPLADPAVITWKTDTLQAEFAFDKDGTPILNSAGEPFQHPIKDDVSHWTCQITKKVPGVPSWIDSYRDAVNSDNVYIDHALWQAGQLKIKSIAISEWQKSGYTWYRTLTLEIKIKGTSATRQDWKHYVLDQGFHYLDSNGKLQPCVTYNGTVGIAKTPQLLTNTGVQYFGSRDPSTVASNCILTFDLRNLRPFSILPLY